MNDRATAWRIPRRTFLGQGMAGLGAFALGGLLRSAGASPGQARWPGALAPPHFVPRARRVIFLYMAGGPSHLETFDSKPKLAELDGQPMPESVIAGQPLAQLQGSTKLLCMAPQFPFQRHGESGQEISTILPHTGRIADDICIIRSMRTEHVNHDPANTFMNTGTSISGRPSMGSWIHYGLGSESEELPGFIVLVSRDGSTVPQPISSRLWHSGILPSRFQGVQFYSRGDPVHYVESPAGVSRAQQHRVIDAVSRINRIADAHLDDPEIEAKISQYELAFRMQASVPELADVSDEPRSILDLYGTEGRDGSFASNCLLARRLAERGVRFIQLYHRGWDHHGSIRRGIQSISLQVDRACAALVLDLKQRGMLDDTLVIWGGEFGRTPMAQRTGRDHHISGFSMWMAGGGIRGGLTYGKTDELGYWAIENPVHVHDLHATILYLLGIDHEKHVYRYRGRDFRLTDVHGRVIHPILV